MRRPIRRRPGRRNTRPLPPYVLVPNHSSLLDIPAMLMAHPDVRFVAAAELFSNRLLAMAMRALGTVPIDRGNRTTSRRQLDDVASRPLSHDLAVFAEGGIAPTGGRLPVKTGAFILAISTEPRSCPSPSPGRAT